MVCKCLRLDGFWYICSSKRAKPNHILLKQQDKDKKVSPIRELVVSGGLRSTNLSLTSKFNFITVYGDTYLLKLLHHVDLTKPGRPKRITHKTYRPKRKKTLTDNFTLFLPSAWFLTLLSLFDG